MMDGRGESTVRPPRSKGYDISTKKEKEEHSVTMGSSTPAPFFLLNVVVLHHAQADEIRRGDVSSWANRPGQVSGG